MVPPFTADQFFQVFVAYNTAVWPAQMLLVGAAVLCLVLAFRPERWAGRAIVFVLAALWAWMAVAYHWAFFAQINPAARIFGVLFLLEAALLLWMVGLVLGHRYPAQPTFGLPCPTTIFTVGILIWLKPRVPWGPLIVPLVWSGIGLTAVFYFGHRMNGGSA